MSSPPPVQRPVFIVAAPLSGAPALLDAFARTPGCLALGQAESPFDDAPSLAPANREWQDNRLTEADTLAEIVADVRRSIEAAVARSTGPAGGDPPRLLHASPKDALRVPFLNALFPDSTFVYLYREPRETLAEMIRAWDSGRFVSYDDLPGWDGPPWSFPLVPGWRELSGRGLEEIVTEQWVRATHTLLSDLQRLPPERWCVAEHTALRDHATDELQRLGDFCDLTWAEELQAAAAGLEAGLATKSPPSITTRQREELERLLPRTDELARAARGWVAVPLAARRSKDPAESPLRSVYTGSFPQVLRQMGSSLLVSTYQTGKLVCLRERQGSLNTHFRNFDKPMGISVLADRIAIGSRLEVWDYRNVPEAAPKIEPAGSHDACFVPRNRHYTGDVAIHEVAYAAGQLWIVATGFSCLATLDADHSFIPRWAPPFITELAPGDRCHLNGLCIVDDAPRYVTALGQTNEPGAWRQNKAAGGCMIDVRSNEIVADGLSMPHSPRWHRNELWVLESGKGELCRVNPATGEVETVAELPGFTRGLAFAGNLAFIGLSQIRETATFGGLPLTQRLSERLCGVWIVDIDSGEIAGFIRFEDLVQEIFDVAILPGVRYPEVAEDRSPTTAKSFVLPPA